MRRLIAGFLVAVLATGCSQKSPFEELAAGPCTSAEEQLVDKHISGQINALAAQDWKLAYSFASAEFQEKVSLNQFKYIIASQYSILIENRGFTFDQCTLTDTGVEQEVSVTSGGQVYSLTYALSVSESVLGVESAEINGAEAGLST
ncbi:Protein of unknown function DUF4864 [Candidatus Nanopelagicaceae bacterium]